MANPEEQTPAPNELLRDVQDSWREYREAEQQSAADIAAAVVAAGGATERDIFVFAMHGILPGRPLDDDEAQIEQRYVKLENTFEQGPVAYKAVDSRDGKPSLRGLAQIAISEDSSPVRFEIKESSPGFIGTVRVAVTDYHTWTMPNDVDKPIVAPKDTIFLNYVEVQHHGSPYADLDYSADYAVGWQEIFGLRKLGAYPTSDDIFLGRIKTFKDNTKSKKR